MSFIDPLYRKLVLSSFARAYRGELRLTEADGAVHLFGGKDEEREEILAAITVCNRNFYRRCVLFGAIGFAESYLAGEWESEDLTKTVAWFILNGDSMAGLKTFEGCSAGAFDILGLMNRFGHLLRPNSKSKSRENISEHYDLGNDFFSLWLDPTMSYSAAYFDPADLNLEAAQIKKWDQLCKKLQLAPQDRVLEIGCGWGGFAIHAAQHYGCHVQGVTISEEQFREATRRVEAAGLSNQVKIVFSDYRDLEGQFDKIVSIEMLEAVGDKFAEVYFKKISDLLAPQGLLGIQTILCPDNQFAILRDGVDFIQKHIFPGSLLLSMRRITEALNKTGDLNLLDYKDMTPFYARTLREWRDAFLAVLPQVRSLGYDEAFIRKWLYYLCYCEAAFGTRHIAVAQIIYTRPDNLSIHSQAYALDQGLIRGLKKGRGYCFSSRHMSPLLLFVLGLAFSCLLMAGVWMIAIRIKNAGIIDIAWALGFAPLALFYRLFSDGEPIRQNLITLMVVIWSVRLGIHLWKRVMGHHPIEDGRYAELRKAVAGHEDFFFFWFFQAQAFLLSLLSIPILIANFDSRLGLGFSDFFAFGIWVIAIAGESLADHQLTLFKRDPANKGKVCSVGLWHYSRHPNYFFEWLIWLSFFFCAFSAPWGWTTIFAPALMLFFLLRVTGIPYTEEQSVRSKGDLYREYQQTTNSFVPWFPKK